MSNDRVSAPTVILSEEWVSRKNVAPSPARDIHPLFHLCMLAIFLDIHAIFVRALHLTDLRQYIFLGMVATAYAVLTYSGVVLASEALLRKVPHKLNRTAAAAILLLLSLWLYADAIIYSLVNCHITRFFIKGVLSRKALLDLDAYLSTLGISLSVAMSIVAKFIPVFVLGILAPHFFDKQFPRFRNRLGARHFAIALAAALGFIHIEQLACKYFTRSRILLHQRNFVPISLTFLSPPNYSLALPIEFKPLADDVSARKIADSWYLPSNPTRNVFVVIIDSLRTDAVDEKTTPYLHAFMKENLAVKEGFTSANNTMFSTFALMHGRQAIYGPEYTRMGLKMGSVPLYLMRKMGYKIHNYGSMVMSEEEEIFGADYRNRDDIVVSKESPPEVDIKMLEKATAAIAKSDGSPIFLSLYLFSSHFAYVWDKAFSAPFTPYVSSSEVFDIVERGYRPPPEKIPALKNRYFNSLRYADSLFGQFIDATKKKGIYDNSIIIVAGDHGEDLFEHNQFGHGFSLTDEETRVPILLRLGGDRPRIRERVALVDLMPTVLESLGVKGDYSKLLDGAPITQEAHRFITTFSMLNHKVLLQTRELKLVGDLTNGLLNETTHINLYQIEERGRDLSLTLSANEMQDRVVEHFGVSDTPYVRFFPSSTKMRQAAFEKRFPRFFRIK